MLSFMEGPSHVLFFFHFKDHYETLRWSDQQSLRKKFGQSEAKDAELQSRSEALWEARDLLSQCRPKDIKMLLDHNSMTYGKASIPWLSHRVADALV